MIHPTAEVQTQDIGNNTYVWQHSIILKGAKIGNKCNINAFCFIENDVVIGDNVTLKCGVYVWDGIRIEDNVFIGSNVAFTNDKVPRSRVSPDTFEQTIIKKGASIGANCTILPNLVIGEYALIGAGSVVTKSIPPYTVWFGNPATFRGNISEDGTLDLLKNSSGK
jgi:UDP-2-acetamido-3-amino-2,3-dideoxy-glucuronate N-acetyltransferase